MIETRSKICHWKTIQKKKVIINGRARWTGIYHALYKYYLIIISDKIKKFITDFYADSDEGKVFTYAEQLVKTNYMYLLVAMVT